MPTSVREPAAWARPGPSAWALRPGAAIGTIRNRRRHRTRHRIAMFGPAARILCPNVISLRRPAFTTLCAPKTEQPGLSISYWLAAVSVTIWAFRRRLRTMPQCYRVRRVPHCRRPARYLICRSRTLPLCVMLRCYECGAMGASVWLVSGTLALWCATCVPEWMTVEEGIDASPSHTMC